MNKYILYIVFLLLSLYSYSQVQNDTSKTKFILTGKVVNNDNQEPISGVSVIVANDFLNLKHSGKTDSLGNYSINIESKEYKGYLKVSFFCIKNISRGSTVNYFKIIDFFSNGLDKILNVNIIPTYTISCFFGPDIECFYYSNKKSLLPDSLSLIEVHKLIKYIKEIPEAIIEIGSHTDCKGAKRRNLHLSNKRAKALINYFVSKGISRKRIIGKGYGETRPLNNCDCKENNCSEKDYSTNRRTEFRIVGGENVNKNNSF